MLKKRNLVFLSLLILGVLLISGCWSIPTPAPALTYTVTFNSQGGSAISSQVVEDSGLATEPMAPTKEDYAFSGWYKESGCTNAWDFDIDTVTADITLYAKWTSLIPSAPTHALRDTGPAGGLIFYVKEGGYSDGWMYLEAAPASTEWTGKEWGSYGTLIGGTKEGIGTGQSNTTKIVTWLNSHSETGRAAQLCDALVYGGYSDWFLPSLDELYLMYANLKVYGVGGFVAVAYYWSSSEHDALHAWHQYFTYGDQDVSNKNHILLQVRAIRAF